MAWPFPGVPATAQAGAAPRFCLFFSSLFLKNAESKHSPPQYRPPLRWHRAGSFRRLSPHVPWPGQAGCSRSPLPGLSTLLSARGRKHASVQVQRAFCSCSDWTECSPFGPKSGTRPPASSCLFLACVGPPPLPSFGGKASFLELLGCPGFSVQMGTMVPKSAWGGVWVCVTL